MTTIQIGPAPTNTLDDKRAAAIKYLRERGKYIADPDCKFKPTPAVQEFNIRQKYEELALAHD